jgi:hypothetical protein
VPVPGSDHILLDLTDGSEWSVPGQAAAQCGLQVGASVWVLSLAALSDSKKTVPSLRGPCGTGRISCSSRAMEVGQFFSSCRPAPCDLRSFNKRRRRVSLIANNSYGLSRTLLHLSAQSYFSILKIEMCIQCTDCSVSGSSAAATGKTRSTITAIVKNRHRCV